MRRALSDKCLGCNLGSSQRQYETVRCCEDSACSKKKGDFKTAIGKTSERYLPQ
jgi:hypothetical protein